MPRLWFDGLMMGVQEATRDMRAAKEEARAVRRQLEAAHAEVQHPPTLRCTHTRIRMVCIVLTCAPTCAVSQEKSQLQAELEAVKASLSK